MKESREPLLEMHSLTFEGGFLMLLSERTDCPLLITDSSPRVAEKLFLTANRVPFRETLLLKSEGILAMVLFSSFFSLSRFFVAF